MYNQFLLIESPRSQTFFLISEKTPIRGRVWNLLALMIRVSLYKYPYYNEHLTIAIQQTRKINNDYLFSDG